MKATDNNIWVLKASLVVTPTADSLGKKDAIITQRDADIASKVAKIATKDAIISNLNANVAQLQQSLNVNKVNKNFLLNMKKKF